MVQRFYCESGHACFKNHQNIISLQERKMLHVCKESMPGSHVCSMTLLLLLVSDYVMYTHRHSSEAICFERVGFPPLYFCCFSCFRNNHHYTNHSFIRHFENTCKSKTLCFFASDVNCRHLLLLIGAGTGVSCYCDVV